MAGLVHALGTFLLLLGTLVGSNLLNIFRKIRSLHLLTVSFTHIHCQVKESLCHSHTLVLLFSSVHLVLTLVNVVYSVVCAIRVAHSNAERI